MEVEALKKALDLINKNNHQSILTCSELQALRVEGQVVYAVNQMNKANIQVDGIILNDVQQGLLSKYSYHYSYAYGNNN